MRGSVESVARSTALRVGTFNIHGGRGGGWLADLDATADVLRNSKLDLVGLNEVHGGFITDQAEDLGTRLGAASFFVPTERRWWHDDFGNGLLTRRPLRSVARIDLPGTQEKGFRNAILTTLKVGDATVTVVAAHIDTDLDRDRQLTHVCELFRSLKAPALLIGDLNCTVDHPAIATLLADPGVIDAVAVGSGSDWERDRVDHIIARGFRVIDAAIVPKGVSDHPHVWVEVTVDEASGQR